MVPWLTSPVEKSRPICSLFGLVLTDKTYMRTLDLNPHKKYDSETVMQWFEEFCAPICNFRVARYKFSKVYQKQGETIDTFNNRILKTSNQWEFSDPDEHLIDVIIFGMSIIKAQNELLQTPKTLNLQQYLTVCHHYESLKLHIKQIRLSKSMDYICQHHNKKKGQSQSSQSNQAAQSEQGSNQRGSSQNNMRLEQSQPFYQSSMSTKCYYCGLTKI